MLKLNDFLFSLIGDKHDGPPTELLMHNASTHTKAAVPQCLQHSYYCVMVHGLHVKTQIPHLQSFHTAPKINNSPNICSTRCCCELWRHSSLKYRPLWSLRNSTQWTATVKKTCLRTARVISSKMSRKCSSPCF